MYIKKTKFYVTCSCPFPHSPHQTPLSISVDQCWNYRGQVMMRAVCVCEDEFMREISGTFRYVLISANSSTEALQLWWAGGWLCGKERGHANIRTQILTQLWVPSGFCRPLQRGRALGEMCWGVNGYWSSKRTRDVERNKWWREKEKEAFECVRLQDDIRPPPAHCLLLIGHKSVDAVPTK